MTDDSVHLADALTAHQAVLDRRQFIEALGTGLVVFFSLDDPDLQAQRGARGYPEDFNAYLRVSENGEVTCYTGKIEQGQGIITALAQMLAEELEVEFESVRMVMGDTALCPWDGGTNGSRSVKYFGPALRAAAAEARQVLVQLAAERLHLPEDRLAAKRGLVFDKDHPGTRVTYGELTRGKLIERHLATKPPLKAPSAFAVCGTSRPRKDALEKATGNALFAGDFRFANMLYAAILRPPSHGAKLKGIDASAAKAVEGARIVEDKDLVAVLHPLPDVARKTLAKIKAEWETADSGLNERNIHAHLQTRATEESVIAEKGEMAKGNEMTATRFEETYTTPYVAHAPIETHSAVATMEEGTLTVRVSTQRPFGVQEEIARVMNLPPGQVRVITPYVGGGFGGKSQSRQGIDAARLCRLTGRPVQVVWTREDEFFNDTFMPAAIVKIRSGLDKLNNIVLWDYQVLFAGERSSQMFYEVPHYRIVHRGSGREAPPAHPFGTGAWRGPGSNTNIFARESHIDVMAARAGLDPLEFRLKNLSDARMIRVLKAAAEKFGWTPAKAPSGRGHGLACLDYLGTYVAAMSEVKVDRTSGKIRAERVVMAQDLGPVINPEGTRMQMEGAITMGLGYALAEKIRFKGGTITDLNFGTYEIPRFSWTPKIETVLIDNPTLDPQGCGEPAVTCMGALMANALFDAVGVRVFDLPLTPDRVKAGIESARV